MMEEEVGGVGEGTEEEMMGEPELGGWGDKTVGMLPVRTWHRVAGGAIASTWLSVVKLRCLHLPDLRTDQLKLS